jgi:hypothetical protein
MTTWKDLKSRRRIRVPEFLEFKKIKTREQLISYLGSVGVEPPSIEELDEIFGKETPINETITKKATVKASTTTDSGTSSWSGVGSRDDGGLSSSGTVHTQATSGSAG